MYDKSKGARVNRAEGYGGTAQGGGGGGWRRWGRVTGKASQERDSEAEGEGCSWRTSPQEVGQNGEQNPLRGRSHGRVSPLCPGNRGGEGGRKREMVRETATETEGETQTPREIQIEGERKK